MTRLDWFIAIALSFLCCGNASAGDDASFLALMEGKSLVYEGTCNFRKDGTFTFKNDAYVSVPCVVGMKLPDEKRHYLVLLNKGKAFKVILFDETTNKNTVLWTKGKDV